MPLTALYLRQLLGYDFAKKVIRFSRYTRQAVQKFNTGNLNNTFRYKTLKLLNRSYSAFRRKESAKKWLVLQIFSHISLIYSKLQYNDHLGTLQSSVRPKRRTSQTTACYERNFEILLFSSVRSVKQYFCNKESQGVFQCYSYYNIPLCRMTHGECNVKKKNSHVSCSRRYLPQLSTLK